MVDVDRQAVRAEREGTVLRLPHGHPIHNAILDFYVEEAHLLDTNDLERWLSECFAEDVHYIVPVQRTVLRNGASAVDPNMVHFDDDLASLGGRVWRLLHTRFGWAEDPPSRVRRCISNVRVHQTETPDEYQATSYLIVYRNRGDSPSYDILSAVRHDRLRQAADGWKIALREVVIDQACLGTPNLAIFL